MRASGELGPDDDVFCIILTSPGDSDMTGPMVERVSTDTSLVPHFCWRQQDEAQASSVSR